MSETPGFERLLKRERTITLTGLAALCALTWLYIVTGAGLGMSAWDMTTLALFPHQHAPSFASTNMAVAAGSTAWGATTWALMIAMWWIMMIAMMTPSAAPTILLFARVQRHTVVSGVAQAGTPIAVFAAGYVLSWLGFAILATATHWMLERAGLISAMMMQARTGWLSGAVLFAAGLYQFSPLKTACLAHCHAPATFLSRHWRPGAAGALRLGVIHGAYCIGCCWLLMALLFVGGVMNLAWIAALAILVMLEKVLRVGPWVARATGIVLIAWGIATLIV